MQIVACCLQSICKNYIQFTYMIYGYFNQSRTYKVCSGTIEHKYLISFIPMRLPALFQYQYCGPVLKEDQSAVFHVLRQFSIVCIPCSKWQRQKTKPNFNCRIGLVRVFAPLSIDKSISSIVLRLQYWPTQAVTAIGDLLLIKNNYTLIYSRSLSCAVKVHSSYYIVSTYFFYHYEIYSMNCTTSIRIIDNAMIYIPLSKQNVY